METLQWLKTHKGFKLNQQVFSEACEGGHLEILKWLRSEGCPWDEATTSNAAWRGHLDVLKWAIDNGCPYEVNHMTRPALEKLGLI